MIGQAQARRVALEWGRMKTIDRLHKTHRPQPPSTAGGPDRTVTGTYPPIGEASAAEGRKNRYGETPNQVLCLFGGQLPPRQGTE